jgi:Bacterial regulatory proteins, tetR family
MRGSVRSPLGRQQKVDSGYAAASLRFASAWTSSGSGPRDAAATLVRRCSGLAVPTIALDTPGWLGFLPAVLGRRAGGAERLHGPVLVLGRCPAGHGAADAAKNREHILAVAREALREAGDASLIGIARRAGVGPGTLYRHFPTREALIAAVYSGDVERLVRSVPQVLAEHAPLDAFRVWFRTLADFVQLKRGLGEALQSPVLQEVISTTYAPVVSAVGELIAACTATAA